jgi:hypothetical protein
MATSHQRSESVGAPRSARRATPGKRDAKQALARAGLIARGVVYGVIGILAFKVAIGAGGRTESQTGAFQTIAHQSFGEVLLIILAIGLAGYAGWRLIQGVAASPAGEERTDEVKRRVSALGSAAGYAVLCYAAVEVIAGAQTSGGSPKHATAGILGWPGGPALVTIAGLVAIGVGLYQGYEGLARKFEDESHTEQMAEATRKAFAALGVVGHVARAVIFILVGYGLIKAAVDYSPRKAVGLDGALQQLAHASGGPLLLGMVALGFLAFALYSIADGRYHRV